jgi:hypothetical protein
MSFSQDVLSYVRASDKPLTSADITKAFPGRTSTQAAVALGDHWRAGRLNRERKRMKGHPKLVIYSYFAPAKEVKAEPLATVPPKAASVVAPAASVPDFALVLADLVTSIADRLATEIVSQVRVKLESEVARQLAEITLPPVVVAPPPPPPPKPVVGVVGMLPAQEEILRKEFDDIFTLRFWNDRTGGSNGQLKSLGANCVAVFIHTDHAGHAAEDTLKSVGATIRRVPGGVTSMKDALTAYFVETNGG